MRERFRVPRAMLPRSRADKPGLMRQVPLNIQGLVCSLRIPALAEERLRGSPAPAREVPRPRPAAPAEA